MERDGVEDKKEKKVDKVEEVVVKDEEEADSVFLWTVNSSGRYPGVCQTAALCW